MGHVLMSPTIKIEILGSQWGQSRHTEQAELFLFGVGGFLNLGVPNVLHMVSTTHSIKFGIAIFDIPNFFPKFPMYSDSTAL